SCLMLPPPSRSPLFPTRRSSDLENACELGVAYRGLPRNPALGGKTQRDLIAVHASVPAQQGTQPPSAVGIEVCFAADTDRESIDEPKRRGEGAGVGGSVVGEILRHRGPCRGERLGQV